MNALHFAGVETYSNGDGDTLRPLDLISIAAYPILHSKGRVTCTYGMVLVSKGRTEQGHDPVAHNLVDGPFITVYGLHHVFEDRVKELPRFLGITVGK